MNQIRDILNGFKWKQNSNFSDIKIWYVHRGTKQKTRVIKGSDIIAIHKTFIETTEAMIPHHRILRIKYQDSILFDRHAIM